MKRIICVIMLLLPSCLLFSQARIPTIMVRPGNAWCAKNECYDVVDNQGTPAKVINYNKALENIDMLSSITEIEGLLVDEGLLVQNMGGASETLEEDVLLDGLEDDGFGGGFEKSAVDIANERIVADIYLDINWEVKSIGPKRQLSYVLVGKDAYTGEPVCNVTGLGDPSLAASDAQLLREAVVMKMSQLKTRLQAHFNTILTMGRLVTVNINVASGASMNLSSMVEGGNLGRVINKWLVQNAVQHRVQPGRSSATAASYKVRIPLYSTDEMPISAEDFAYNLSDYLATSPYNVSTRVINRGLGGVVLVINGGM